jgi:hypothetical protein
MNYNHIIILFDIREAKSGHEGRAIINMITVALDSSQRAEVGQEFCGGDPTTCGNANESPN